MPHKKKQKTQTGKTMQRCIVGYHIGNSQLSKTNKIAFYLRISTVHQNIKEGSLKAQEQRLNEWLEYNNKVAVDNIDKKVYDNFVIYKDVESGASKSKRTGYQRMIADLQMKKIHAIACTSISRLNRNIREFYELLDLAEDYQIDIISLKENFDTSTAIGRALLKFMLVFYELEREQTAERGSDNRYERAKRGLWITSTIIGYENDSQNPGHPTIIPTEAELIKKIFKLYINSGSISNVRNLLKQKGLKTPARKLTGSNVGTPKDFADETIRRILQNKAYIGVLQYQKGNMGKKDLPYGKAYEEFQGVWKSIIDEDMFEKANEILKSNSLTKSNAVKSKKKTYELSGIITCGNCSSSTMKTTSGTSKTGKQHHYYKCMKCSTSISAKRLEQALINTLDELGDDEKLVKRLVKDYQDNYNTELLDLENSLKELKIEEEQLIKEIDNEIENFTKLLENKLDTFIERVRKKHDNLSEKLDVNHKMQLDLENKVHCTKMDGIDFDYLQMIFTNIFKIVNEIPSNTRRALYYHIIKSFKVFKDRAEMEISDDIYSLSLDTKKGQNEKFVVTPVERDGRDSNSQRPA